MQTKASKAAQKSRSDSDSSSNSEDDERPKKKASSSESSDSSVGSIFSTSSSDDSDSEEYKNEDDRRQRSAPKGVTVRKLTAEELSGSKLLIQNKVVPYQPGILTKMNTRPFDTEEFTSEND